jgi:hypothetical protein
MISSPSDSSVKGARAKTGAARVQVPGAVSDSRGALLVKTRGAPASVALPSAARPAAQRRRVRNSPARSFVEAVPAASGKRSSRFWLPPAAGAAPSAQRAAWLQRPLPLQE